MYGLGVNPPIPSRPCSPTTLAQKWLWMHRQSRNVYPRHLGQMHNKHADEMRIDLQLDELSRKTSWCVRHTASITNSQEQGFAFQMFATSLVTCKRQTGPAADTESQNHQKDNYMTKVFQPAWQKDEVSKGISELTYLTEASSRLDLQSF